MPLELLDVRAAYGSIDVLHGVNITIAAGQVYALLGPNGAGKSTTLKVASGQLKPTAGEVRVPRRPTSTGAAPTRSPATACASFPRAAASSRTSPCSRTSAW